MKFNRKYIIVVLILLIILMFSFRKEGFTPEQIDSIVSKPELNIQPNQMLTIKALIKDASEKGELETNPHLQFVFLKIPGLKDVVMATKGV